MTEMRWYEVYPPAGVGLPDITAALRPLGGRARQGIWRTTPPVTFECWITHRKVRWLLGVDNTLARTLPDQLKAQLPGLHVVEQPRPTRPSLNLGMTVRSATQTHPLRLDTAPAVTAALMRLAGNLGKREAITVQWVVGPAVPRYKLPASFHLGEALGLKPPPQPNSGERQAWRAKTIEPIFLTQGRIGVRSQYPRRSKLLLSSAFSGLRLVDSSKNRLVGSRPSARTARRISSVTGRGRPAASLLNAAEVAAVLAWPIDGTEVPGQAGPALSPAPRHLLAASDSPPSGGRILGQSLHPADRGHLVSMPIDSCLHHLHVIGPTGSGKSTLLANLALADAAAGHGLLVMEPKGDLIRDLLARLPEERHEDVVLIEPADTGRVVGINPLAGPAIEAERRADELLGLFKELFGSAIGARSSDLLLHALITAARLPGGTLADVPMLLSSPGFRRKALSKVNDELVLAPFWARFDDWSEAERTQAVAPVLNKLRAFLSRSAVRRMLGQPQPGFTLDQLFTRRKIVLVNLSRGLVGPETAKLLGSLLLSQLWQAIQRRASTPPASRQSVMVVIDEWQDYAAGLDFGDVLAQARGHGVGFTLAHQHLDQLKPSLRSAVLANARSRTVFRPAKADTEALADVLGGSLTADDLERLDAFQAACRLLTHATPSQPFTLQTLDLPKKRQNVVAMRNASMEHNGVDGQLVDAQLIRRWRGGETAHQTPVGARRRTNV